MRLPYPLAWPTLAMVAALGLLAVAPVFAGGLIPRRVLFGNPDRASVRVSPDGRQLSFLAPVDGVLNVWVCPLDDPGAARPVTADTVRGIRVHFWAHTSHHVIYAQDRGGDENWRIYSVDLSTGQEMDLTPLEGVQARVQQVSPKYPHELLVALNDRDPTLHDVYRVDIRTGQRRLVQENPGQLAGGSVAGYVTDDDFRVRFADVMLPDGGQKILAAADDGRWVDFETVPAADLLTTGIWGFDRGNEAIFMGDSRGRNTAALYRRDLVSGRKELIAEDPVADVDAILQHPEGRQVQAVSFNHTRQRWSVIDRSILPDMQLLTDLERGDLTVTARSQDDRVWIVAFDQDAGPVRYYRYDRPSRTATYLFSNRRELEGLRLVAMHPLTIRSRDGLDLVSYLSLPAGSDADGDGRPQAPLPMVLVVHGGPWARDAWGYDPFHQWLANRGYAVLTVNFRGSTGFGKAFVNAGDLEWGRRMHDDLVDAVDWAVAQGIADPRRVGIMGGSYGGYATLVGLTLTPERFACGVDIVGPSNLVTLLQSIPPYWKPMLDLFATRVGDPRTEAGQALLRERSPLSRVEAIVRPLLIGQGANDPRVKQAEADQIVVAMQEREIPVTYVLFTDEGHGFARPQNRLAFNAVTEAFLAQHLGGAYEPIGGDFTGASIRVPAGAALVPGVSESLEE